MRLPAALARVLRPADSAVRLREDEGGFSIAEVMVAVMVLGIATVAITSMLVSTTRATVTIEEESRSVDELRVAMGRIEREFRSAECVREPDPAGVGDSATGSTLRFTTRVGGGTKEITYSISGGVLSREVDSQSYPLAVDVVDGAEAFTYEETPRRSVDVVLTVQPAGGNARELRTTIAGRNAWRSC